MEVYRKQECASVMERMGYKEACSNNFGSFEAGGRVWAGKEALRPQTIIARDIYLVNTVYRYGIRTSDSNG
jgi:hypothetical protein